VRRILRLILTLAILTGAMAPAGAVESVRVPLDAQAIDLTNAVERNDSQSDRLQVSTAPGSDGIVRRIEVSAREAGTKPAWIVFALTNDTEEQIERLIVAPYFRLVGSGVISPDLGASRVSAITASQGFPPEREDSGDADVFRLTLDPGTTITYVAELRTPNLPQIYLWEPDAYKDKVTSLTLYKGIVIGIAGLLALFLTIVFVVKGAVIFPAAAALAWAVLVYVCIDFGFWQKILGASGTSDQIWRASAETFLAATLSVFLFAYLNLSRWHVRASHVVIGWLALLTLLAGIAIYDPPVAAGVARISLATVAIVGFILVIYLALHGIDRAVMLIPTWFLLFMWVCAAAFTVTGYLTNDLVSPALVGGLVLIVMLIGFTVMQNAFAVGGLAQGAVSDIERKALALTGAGDVVFDWDVTVDHIHISQDAEQALGMKPGSLDGPASDWFDVLHPFDRDRYSACLDTVLEQRRGRIHLEFRLRGADGHYLWFLLKARPVVGADGEVIRVVGTLADITETKISEERMMHDAVHDNLTGLPNRELFFDRLTVALRNARATNGPRPSVIAIDLDRFRQVNDAAGLAAGDSVLLTSARRLGRMLNSQDTLARIASDQFAIIVLSETGGPALASLADRVRKTVAMPVTFNDREIVLSVSAGLATPEPQQNPKPEDMLKDAEIAVAFAKRGGGNRTEVFKPSMTAQRSDRLALEADLRRALDRNEIGLFFQPIVRLEDRTIAGFESHLRWNHPRLGRLTPADFVPLAEETGLIADLGIFAMERAARELGAWQQALNVDPPIYATVRISSRQLLRHDLIADVKSVLTRSGVSRGSLKLEIPEYLMLENPEHSAQMLVRLRELGAGLVLADFGTGYSSLSYLQRFAFDTIKIDRSFVQQTVKGARPRMLRSLVAMAHDNDMDVIAQGAESESDVIELFQIGCAFGQGNIFGQSITPLEARKLMGASTDVAA
jgi:diguanylate cyclase (GGDEF)-like protein/PAS domain S-box-containing protein